MKGLIAIQRCEILQVETAAEGRPCLCPTRRAYQAQPAPPPRRAAPPVYDAREADEMAKEFLRTVMKGDD